MNTVNSGKTYIDRAFSLFLVHIKAGAVFVATVVLIYFIGLGTYNFNAYLDRKAALAAVPDPQKPDLEMVKKYHDYDQVVQTWFVPPYKKWISPISWLKFTENCIMSSRLNAMKFAGMIPGHWDIDDFVKHAGVKDFAERWGLHTGRVPLTDEILADINKRINKNSKYTYHWVSIKNKKELIYLARRGHHVMIYTQVWLGPTKKYPKPVKYLGLNFAHACTVTGIKSHDPEQDIFEFSIYETLPMRFLTLTPVYNKVTKDGCNLFDRQSIPFIISYGKYSRSGYIVRRKKPETIIAKNNN